MIRKKPASDLIRGGGGFSEKIMLYQKARAPHRFNAQQLRSKGLWRLEIPRTNAYIPGQTAGLEGLTGWSPPRLILVL
jgi:hypothetical protein